MFFSFKQEINGRLLCLDVEVSRQQSKFVATVFAKPTFSSAYTHFDSFQPTVYKVGMVYTLAYRISEFVLIRQHFMKNLIS